MASLVPLVIQSNDVQQLQAADVLADSGGLRFVRGPASATDNAIPRWDGTTGILAQDSLWTIADTTGLLVLSHTNYEFLAGSGAVASATPTSTDNVVIGTGAGASASFTGDNWFLGSAAGASSTWVRDNVAWGRNAGNGGTYGNQNIMVGLNAGLSGVFDEANLALGASAMRLLLGGGDNNIALGAFSLFDATAGSNNLCIGASSGRGLDDAAAGNNIFLGINAGGAAISQLTTVTSSVAIGADVATLANGEIRLGGTQHTSTYLVGALTVNDAGSDFDFRLEGDTLTHMIFTDASAATENIAFVTTAAPNWQTMDRGLFLGDATTVPTGNPSAGAFIYSESGVPTTRTSGGAITPLGFGIVTSGTYTPTASSATNLDATPTMTQAQYMRVGATVTVSGRFTADPTAPGAADFEIDLPVASNIGAAEDVAGVAFSGAIAGQGAEIIGVVANDTAQIQWIAVDITSQLWSYQFSYQVI